MIIYCDESCGAGPRRAALELERCLRALTGAGWVASMDFPTEKGIVLCTADAKGEAGRLLEDPGLRDDLAWAGDDGYVITSHGDGADPILLVCARSWPALAHGAFRLASLAGARFYLSRDVLAPSACHAAFRDPERAWPDIRIAERPRFAVRGGLPWFNFLSGPTAWDEEDWAVYIDSLARSRANTVGFHVYTGGLERYYPYVEPFAQVAADGVLPEAELDTTATARWGYRPLSTKQFAAGSGLCYEGDVFGSEVALPRGSLPSRYARAQRLLQSVMERAQSWGIRPFIGIEVGIAPPEVHSLVPASARLPGGELDPFHPAAVKVFENTLAHLIETYPHLDALYLFQHEHVAFSGTPPNRHDRLQAFCDQHAGAFSEVDPLTRWQGPWLLAWLQLAWKWKERCAPHLRLAVGGWGGGRQFPRLLPGLHRTLPDPFILSLLLPGQGAAPLPQEIEGLHGRERWAIPWWEGDIQLWHPQPRIESLVQQQATLATYGFEGSVGLHWRTRDVEANAWAFFETGWETRSPALRPAVALYADYAAHGLDLGTEPEPDVVLPGTSIREGSAVEAGRLLHKSEVEGWFAAIRSPEYHGYTSQWGRIGEEKRESIAGMREKLAAMHSACGDGASLSHLVAVMDFVLYFDRWSRHMGAAEQHLANGDAAAAWDALSEVPVADTLRAYMSRITTQGELGVLAGINQKAWLAYRDLVAAVVAELDDDLPRTTKAPERPFSLPAVVLPVRSLWRARIDTRMSWRVLTGSPDVGAVFLKWVPWEEGAGARSGSVTPRRLMLEQSGPCRFRGEIDPGRWAGADARALAFEVELYSLDGALIKTLPASRQTVVIESD